MAVLKGWESLAKRAAAKHGLDPNVFVRQIRQESGGNATISSPAGARGIAQIMPATAKAWGVNPLDPAAALDAAARNMASYVKKYGGYENALRAYNAGPGAIEKSKGFAETNHYVKVILGGRDPGKLGKPGKAPAGRSRPSGGTVTATTRQPGVSYTVEGTKSVFDQEGFEKAQKLASLNAILGAGSGSSKNWGLLRSVLPQTADPAAFTKTVNTSKEVNVPGASTTVTRSTGAGRASSSTRSTGGGGGKLPGLEGTGSKLLELIYNGQNKGYAVKDGKNVNGPSFYSGVWAGHANHVHVAAGPKTAVALGKLAQQMGLRVGENKHFDKVDPVHSPNSYHYRDMALDVSGDPRKMAKYAAKVKRIYGL